MKRNKVAVVLLSSFLMSCTLPTINAYALSNEIPVVSSYTDEALNIKFEAISDTAVKITNPDGTVDIMERKSDGVYLNGEFYMPLLDTPSSETTVFRAAPNLNQWYYVGTSQGTAEGAANASNLGHSLVALLLGLGWNPVGVAYSTFAILLNVISPGAPGAYYRTSLYVHPQNRKLKIVTSYYKNANYTGYVTTVTRYSDLP